MISAVGCSAVTMPTLWPCHQGAVLHVAIDHRAAQCACPEVLDFKLRCLLVQFAGARQRAITSCWVSANLRVALFASARTGITGKRGSTWTLAVASRAAPLKKAFLKSGWATLSCSADEAGAELAAGRTHFQIREHRFTATNAACNEHRNILHVWQDFLRQNGG